MEASFFASYYEKFADGKVVCIDEEIPFEIPATWEWSRLGSVFELRSGQDFPPEKYNEKSLGVPYITGASNFDGTIIIQNRWTEFPSVLVSKGCLLLVCKGSGVGKMCLMNFPQAHIARQIQAIIPFTPDIIIDFLKLTIECRLYEITSQANGVIPGIARDATLSFLLPIPPLREQIRILEKIEELAPLVLKYDICESRLEHINKVVLSSLRKSILQEAIQGRLVAQDASDEPASILLQRIKEEKLRLVKEGMLKKKDVIDSTIFRGDDNKYYEKIGKTVTDISEEIPFSIPNSWAWSRLSGAVNIIMGQSPDGNDVFEADEVDNAFEFHQGKICFTDKFITPSGKWCKVPSRIAEIGSLLICVRAPIGDVNITQRQIGIGRGLAAITGYKDIKSDFLFYWLLAHKKNLVDKGTGSTFKAITVEVLKDLIIPLPPLVEQQRIVTQIKSLFDRIRD